MISWYTALPSVQPWWWRQFVRFVNVVLVEVMTFFQTLSLRGILYVALGIWLLVMGIWIRQFSTTIARLYGVAVLVYFTLGVWLLF
jgi:hypothetical protein